MKTMFWGVLLFMTVLAQASVTKNSYGKLPNGTPVDVYVVKDGDVVAHIITYGATVVSLSTPDRNHRSADIVLGYDSLDGYLSKSDPYFGAIVGRYANRIGGAKFALDGKTYHVPANDAPNSLHGGLQGFYTLVRLEERRGGE